VLNDVVTSAAEDTLLDDSEASVQALVEWVQTTFPIPIQAAEIKPNASRPEAVAADIFERVKRAYELKSELEDQELVKTMERHILLQSIDSHWQDYLRAMDALRQGVGLRAYGQRDPLVEYKREAFQMFDELMSAIKQDVATAVFRSATSVETFESFLSSLPQTLVHDDVSLLGGDGAPPSPGDALPPGVGIPPQAGPQRMPDRSQPLRRETPKVGRNDPCPCGSGKKYKKCCGK
jgi:preprotein translocase subunit SecA